MNNFVNDKNKLMKKALLYTLLFVLLTIVVFFALFFALPFLVWSDSEAAQQNNVFDSNPLLLPSLSVIVWAIITLYIFIRNQYADLSFGNIEKSDRWKMIIVGGLSIILLKTALQPLQWIMNNEIPESRYSIIQMWMDNDILMVSLLSLIHLTSEAVILSAILRELIIWSKRPIISSVVVAILFTLPGLAEFNSPAILPMLCSFLPLTLSGWIYYHTGSIWPVFFGMTAYDFMLVLTPISEYITAAVIAAVAFPWVVIYLAKRMSEKIKPITSR